MIIIFCGMPASGKSTIAHRIKERLGNIKTVVSDDIARDRYSRIITMVDEQIGKYHYQQY